ncbi:Type 1 glutamine amidotransferase-like domain-containing protein [Gloeocapsa sp. PCC 7428]|uniref:Type 1 glutamine amidotransferase-like domain-containing protein n=1 Tax=Gloeocapsa sp. PCC 7428 TaxID=1173026 RepID=UPI00030687A0|nr:Type 1 glutamine amidotransferase-like domain-containing protein [Gloeocapsa sp. PCC 7428]
MVSRWELDKILKEAWESGVILAGLSAGSICWFEQGVTDSLPGELTVLPCLGWLGVAIARIMMEN